MLKGPALQLDVNRSDPCVTPVSTPWQATDLLMHPKQSVDLWLLEEAILAPHQTQLAALLNPDEQRRAQNLVRAEDRLRFMLFRGALRHLLARYLAGQDPAPLTFDYGPRGKPALVSHPTLHFNLSHARDRMAVAVSDRPAGVDLERMDRATDMIALAERFFHPHEAACLRAAAPADQPRLFFRWWTAKEALLKAWGVGLTHEGEPLDFSAWPGARAAELTGTDGASWLLWPLPLPGDWMGALVADAGVTTITLRSPG